MMKNNGFPLNATVHCLPEIVPVEAFFYALSEGGKRPGSLLYESQDEHGKFTGFSLGITRSSVSLSGKGDAFAFTAMDALGERLLVAIKPLLPSAVRLLSEDAHHLTGTLAPDLSKIKLQDRLNAINHTVLMRLLLCDLQVEETYAALPLGIYGGFAYDFVRQFEALPATTDQDAACVDYRFYLPAELFIVDHLQHKTYLIAFDHPDSINEMKKSLTATIPMTIKPARVGVLTSNLSKEEFLQGVDIFKQHILMGDVFQVQYGRNQSATFEGDAFSVYRHLKQLNPSPFMFYMQDHEGVLLGASPELALSVTQEGDENRVTITPIAGTKPRGMVNGKIHPQLDQRYAIALQTDAKELAEHVMLIDLARNDIAAIAKPGTTVVDESIVVKKYSHVQHLVSRVSGLLQPGIDALTAYLATMNMGTLTGAPKPKAMAPIARYEKLSRGFYGGGFGFITHQGEMETAIIIRSMRIQGGRVFLRASAGLVLDSVPESEYLETENKMRSCVRALEEASK